MNIKAASWVIDNAAWQAFGTLTFRTESNVRRGLPLFTRLVAHSVKLHGRGAVPIWCLRFEHGESFGRAHMHFLLGGYPSMRVHGTTVEFWDVQGCFWARHQWTWLHRGGWARVRPFREYGEDSAGEYLLKGLANSYERSKFSVDVVFSHSLQLKIPDSLSEVHAENVHAQGQQPQGNRKA